MRSLSVLLTGLVILAFLVHPVIADNPSSVENAGREPMQKLRVVQSAASSGLSLFGQAPFHVSENAIADQRLVELRDSAAILVTWNEIAADGCVTPYFAISRDGGRSMARITPTSYLLKLRFGDFDPATGESPADPTVAVPAEGNLYLVQFITQPLEEFRNDINALGGTIYKFIPNHAYFVRMSPTVRDAVAALPYVRGIVPVRTEYKLEEEIIEQLQALARATDGLPADKVAEPRLYSVMCNERGSAAQERVAAFIRAIGGTVHGLTPEGFRLEATLALDQVPRVAALDDVMFIDRKGEIGVDMDLVRALGGANYLETVAGFNGQGVRAEVADTELNVNHTEWPTPPIIHRPGSSSAHGTSVYGILFARGVQPQARGLIPGGQGIFACSTNGLLGGGQTRYQHTAELVNPAGPYRAVLQTNSTGDSQTTEYTTISAEMDDLLFLYDITLTQSQSNMGNRNSRPQAWAKNIISGGAVNHYNTLTRNDDCWCSTASIGPASDGRIKPDLCFFYDLTYTTSSSGYTEFGGTSGATPSIAGYVGLFYQMWASGIFGNEVDPAGDVFDNRCHMSTAKAVMINTANPYPFTGANHDLTRVHQGWGNPDIAYLFDVRNNISIIDETEILGNMESIEYSAYVEPGTPQLRVTLVFTDTMGVPSASQQRINDLSLRVVSPSGTIYWGNNGLLTGNWSVPGGTPNTIDTVENVFVQNPESGVWSVTVFASEVNEDTHLETPALDADFALVLSGGFLATCTSDGRVTLGQTSYACTAEATIRVVDCDLNADDQLVETVTVTIVSDTEPSGETVLLTETAPETADFRGTISLRTTDGVGILRISPGDAIVVTYEDADDGTGQPATVTATATVDCAAPTIFNVQVADLEPRRALVTFETDEPTLGAVRFGTACGNLTQLATQSGYGTEHSVILGNLTDGATHFFAVEATDVAGNSFTDDNGGACYSFTTPDIPNYFTEMFTNNDLDNISLIFVPNGSYDFYRGCAEPITQLPTNPAGGTTVTLSDDSYATVNVQAGRSVSIYGQNYTTYYIGSNGYITFGAGDTDYTESLADHFNLPRISALFDDLYPPSGGTISWRQLDDRVAVTWLNIREISTGALNTFQIEMFFNGEIHINYLDINISDGLAGLSAGNGLDPDYFPTDLSEMGGCGPTPPIAFNGQSATTANVPVTVTLLADDDGLPEPGVLQFVISTLPQHGTLIDPDAGAIPAVPYTLVNNGNQVTYQPDSWYHGADSFTFMADDGGQPPEGGYSNEAVISLNISLPPAEQALFIPFDSNPGWTAEGQWAFGQPTGGGTHNFDPVSGYTGANVYGYNLTGDYPNNMAVRYLTTTPLDCSRLLNTELRFWRWLGVERRPYDQAALQISADGVQWTTLWQNPTQTIADTAWTQMVFNISAVADRQPAVYLRWSMGPTDASTTYPGWNIDDLELWAVVMTPDCPGDLDGDGDVDIADLAQLLSNYGMTGGALPGDGDLDGDGDVDIADLAGLLAVYGSPC